MSQPASFFPVPDLAAFPPPTQYCPVHHRLEPLHAVAYQHAVGRRGPDREAPDERPREYIGRLVCGASRHFVTSTAQALARGWLPVHLR